MNATVHYERQDEIALITVDNPPVNALSQSVREGLLQSIGRTEQDSTVKAVVLLCNGRTFMAGADIKEFGKPPQSPMLPDVITAFERSGKPSVAVIHGTALGGGLEVAMGCHYRIAHSGAQVGLPEVKLGLLPGAGGTQRLPRLAGVAKALDMIVSGTPIKAADALQHHIVDEIIQGDDLRTAGIAFARKLLAENRGVRRTCDQTQALQNAGNDALIAAKRDDVEKRMRGLFSPQRCISAVEAATRLSLEDGMKAERSLFMECMQSPQRAALIHTFFSERQCAHIPDLPKDTAPRSIAAAAVVGGGTMGTGIAMCFANAGIPVSVLEVSNEAVQHTLERARGIYATSVRHGRLAEDVMEKRLGMIQGVTDYKALAGADLVIEAVFESMDVKQQVFEQLDKVCKTGAILASNTSSLDINVIAGFTRRPHDVVGMHFFSPANVMRLLEVVRGAATAPEVLATAIQVGKKLKKVTVPVGVCNGFVGNRMIFQYARESEFLLEEGATPEQVDGVLRQFGMAMGPNAMRDLSGLDIGMSIRKEQGVTPGYPQPLVLERVCAAGMLGQKNGRGFFLYKDGSRKPEPNPEILPILEAISRERGIERKPLTDEYIIERTLYALINEGAKILEEGIALRSSDIDIIYLYGYGFPAWRGGPMFYADSIGLDKVLGRIHDFHERFGAWWKPGPLLEKLVAEGKTFASWDTSR